MALSRKPTVGDAQLTAVQRRIKEKLQLNKEDEHYREQTKAQLGFDPATTIKTKQAVYADNITLQSLYVNASFQELEKRGEALSSVRHGSLVPAPSKIGAGLNNASKSVPNDEIVFDASGQPCRKVLMEVRLKFMRNLTAIPIGGRFDGFACSSNASSPYSNDTFDLVLEPHIEQHMDHVLYSSDFTNEGIVKLVQDWGHVTQEKIDACFHSKGETHDIRHNSLIHNVMTEPKFSSSITPDNFQTYTHEVTGEPVHVVSAAISQKVVDYVNNEVRTAPFYTLNKIGIKYSRADGQPWASGMLGGPTGTAISDLVNRSAGSDILTDTQHFGVGLQITFKLIPLMYGS